MTEGEHITESDLTLSQKLEIEKHLIKILPEDTDRDVLVKIATNLDGKTVGFTKMRRGLTEVRNAQAHLATEFAAVRAVQADHAARFQRFDELCQSVMEFLERVWREIKDTAWQGAKKALTLFITAVVLYVLYSTWSHFFPGATLTKSTP